MREGLRRYGAWFVVLATALLVGVPVLAGGEHLCPATEATVT
jgi:hypothetical protein